MMTLQISAIILLEDHNDMETFHLCIRYCEPIADEIIVVSMLSSQSSSLESWQSSVKWMESAGLSKSEALNNGIDEAQGLWILRLNAAEMLVGNEMYRLQMLANRFDEEAFYFPMPTRPETKYTVPYETRLFRNRVGHRYRGHSICCLPLELEDKATFAATPLIQPAWRECQPTDGDRVVHEPGANFWLADPAERFHLSVMLANHGSLKEAKQLWEELRMEQNLPLRYEGLLFQWEAQMLEENGRVEEALACINEGLMKQPHDVMQYLIKGRLLFLLHEQEAAEEVLHHCLQSASLPDGYIWGSETIQSKAWYALGIISESKEHIDQAMTYYGKSYELDRSYTAPLYATARLVHEREGEERLLALLNQRIDEKGGKQQLLRAKVLFAERLYKEAKHAAELAWRSSMTLKDPAMMVISESLLMMGNAKDAILSFAKIPEQSPFYCSALLRTCLAYWILSDWHKAKDCLTLLQSHTSDSGSPYADLYMSIHLGLTGEQEAALIVEKQDFVNIEAEFHNIIRCLLQLNRNDLIELLIPFFDNNPHLYPYAGELLYEYGQYSYADQFAAKVLAREPEHEKMGVLFLRSKKKQNKEHEAAQWLSLHLGDTMTSPQRYVQYVDILRDWVLTIASMGMRDYPQDESLKRYYQAAKELQLG